MWSTCMDTESLCLYTHRCEYGTCVSRCPVWPMPSTWLLNIHTYACGHYRHTTIGARLEWSESYTSRVWSCLCLKFCYFVHHGFFFALILIFLKYCIKIFILGASQVSQWLRICLAMQGTLVRSLVQDPTCHGATKPVHHNYWACALEPLSHNYWTHRLQLLKPEHPRACAPQQEKPPQWEARAPQRRVDPPLTPARESLRAAVKTHHRQKVKINLI